MSEYFVAVLIGIVEGLTEYLPISSTGHMILVGNMIGFNGDKASVFEVFIQLGAILSVLILYRDKFLDMLRPEKLFRYRNNGLCAAHVLVGIVPVMIIGFILHKPIKNFLFSPMTVIIGLIIGALFMFVSERFSRKHDVDDVDGISLKQAFFVGLFQILSLWPGFSRSGSTISGGLILGMSRKAAAEFSFIIAVPLMTVACLYDFLKIWDQLDVSDLKFFATGFIVAFIVAYASVIWLIKFLNRYSLASFAIYRIILAAFSSWYFFIR